MLHVRGMAAALKSAALRWVVAAAAAAVLVGPGLWQRSLAMQAPVVPDSFVCFPSCAANDARFLVLAGANTATLSGNSLVLSLTAPPSPTPSVLKIGIFDGETGGRWDTSTAATAVFELFADPMGDGTGAGNATLSLGSWSGATMVDNGWYDLPAIPNTSLAQDPVCTSDCPFRYVMVATNSNPTQPGVSVFKVRTTGTFGLRPQSFGFMAAVASLPDLQIIYPAWPATAATTYDGTWTFAFSVPAAASSVTVWDGDLDYGAADCLTSDTNDVNSLAFPVEFPITPSAVAQGVAVGTGCATGAPADDAASAVTRRQTLAGSPANIIYRLIDPAGTAYLNSNPSGNLEWERFRVDLDVTPAVNDFNPSVSDYQAASLPGGIYAVKIEGTDVQNLNFFSSQYSLLGLTPPGDPAPEDAFYTIQRYVWRDSDSDGVFDATELGIPGVVVRRTNTTTGQIETTTTDSTGAFTFRVAGGTYSLTVDAANSSGPLSGLHFTGNNGTGTHTGEFVGGLELGPANPYERRDFGYNTNTPPVVVNDGGLCICGGTSTFDVLSNDSDADNDALTVTAVSQPASGTATLNGNGTVTYAPNAGYLGADTFTYTISDGNGGTATGTVDVTVMNNPAFVADDSATTNYQTPVTVAVLDNDNDPDGLPLTVASAGQGANGSTVVNLDGTITYTPNVGYFGNDEFIYTVRDACGADVIAVVRITVTPLLASISGYVYVDSNNDGVKDAGEAAIALTTVALTGTDGIGAAVNLTTTTDGAGYYQFATLVPGTYAVTETQPAGYFDGKDTQGTPGTGTVNNDQFATVTLASGVHGTNNNFGELQAASIAGFVYDDTNDDGVKDVGEAPIAGAVVTLTGTNVYGVSVPVGTTAATDALGAYAFNNLVPGTYTVTESQPLGYLDGKDTQGTPGTGTVNSDQFALVTLASGAHGVNNNFGEIKMLPSITIVKKTNGSDNDAAPGVYLAVGAPVTWTYDVTNTGNVALTAVNVTDDKGVAVTCPATVLAVGATMTCTGTGVAAAGQYENTGCAVGTSPTSATVNACNPDHYFGQTPSISIIKKTNGSDNNSTPGVLVPTGSTVTWTYEITNTGNVALTDLALVDDKIGAVSCPVSALAVGASTTCTTTGTALAGQYTNLGTVTGKPPVGPDVTANDPDNYYGSSPNISIIKKTNGSDNNSAPGIYLAVGAAVTWTYDVTNTGNVALTAVNVTDDKGVAVTCPATVLAVGATMTCTGTGVAAAGQYENTGCAVGTSPTSATVNACNPDHYYGETPQLAIVKKTNGSDNDAAPGVYLAVGAPVTWTYDVTNTGNVALTAVNVTDDKGVAVTCPATVLAVGATMTCTGTGVAAAGQYENTGCAVGTSPTSATVNACNPDHYYGETPQLAIVKKTNGSDNDAAPGVYLAVGAPVTWTYDVTNTGNVALTAVNVTDDKGVAVTCPATVLAVGATMTCTGTGVAAAGQYENTGCAVGTSPTSATVNACNPDHYYGETPQLAIVKKTNGSDNDAAPGIYLAVGAAVTWTYDVTNTGNVALTAVNVTDDKGVAVTCPATVLAVGATMTCTGTGVAAAGQYENTGCAVGTSPTSATVNACNPDHYYGETPQISIVKKTNGSDSDAAPGIYLAVGAAVTWTYDVTNTGNVALTAVNVTDDKGVAVTCPATVLAVGATMTCTGTGVAAAGQYENTGCAVGTSPTSATVNACNPDHYYGETPQLAIVKKTNGSDNDAAPGVYLAVGAAVTWTYDVTNTGNVALTAVNVTDDKGVAVSCPATALAMGATMTCTGTGVAAAGQYENTGCAVGTSPTSATVNACNPDHYYGQTPSIAIIKKTNGSDNNSAPGVYVAVGSTVSFSYDVTNTGNVALTNVTVTDDKLPGNVCVIASLAAGATQQCTASTVAVAGQYVNMGTVVGTPPSGPPVTDEDPDHHYGQTPSIAIVKKTNGSDNDAAPGVYLAVGAPVTWTYDVTNTGNVALTAVNVTDDKGVAVTCPATVLAVGATMTCTGTGVAAAGQYANTGCAVGTSPTSATVNACNPDHYFGQTPSISIIKKTNGSDNNSAPGVQVMVGSTVTWTYTATNTGNVALTNVVVVDDRGVAVICPADTLAVGATMTCAGTGIAAAGQYTNVGTVTGVPPAGPPVTDEDPDNYFGLERASLSGFVYVDANNDGVKDGSETPIGGTTVTLTGTDVFGAVVSTTLPTNAVGFYEFANLVPGTYTVTESQPAGYLDGKDTPGSTGGVMTNDQLAAIALVSAANSTNNNFGELEAATLSGYVYVDANNDGVKDASELPIAGAAVTLTGTPVYGAAVSTPGTTNASGFYSFTGLVPGTYKVTETQPTDYLDGLETVGSAGGSLAVNDVISGIVLASGASSAGNNFGEIEIRPGIAIVKTVNNEDANAAPGVYVTDGAAVRWDYTVTNAGNVALANVVVRDDAGTPGNLADDFSAGYQTGDTNSNGMLDLTETWTFMATGTARPGQYTNWATVTGEPPGGSKVTAKDPANYYGEKPAITIVKQTNGSDNDAAPGVYLAVGAAVTWTYDVTNTGNVALTAVNVTDDKGVAVTCPAAVLAVGATMTCTGTGVAAAGQYENTGCAVGTSPTSATVNACNPDHYYGQTPSIAIVKKTNGSDNNSAPGVYVAVGSTVSFSYDVTNTGNVALANVTVTDDKLSGNVCVIASLAAGATQQCTASTVAVAGQYVNMGTVVGTPPSGPPVTDEDPDHHYGQTPSIAIVKKTNGSDNNSAPGVYVAVGSTVSFSYDVTNTGNVALANVTVTDDKLPGNVCVIASLAAGATQQCTASTVAVAGQYVNMGTVVGTPPSGPPVTDEDPDHHYGQTPSIAIVKKTNGSDSDAAPGIYLAVGAAVTWTYDVTNTGNVALTAVNVTDDKGVAVTCPATVLAVGATMTCTGTGVAAAGQYENTGCAVGTSPTSATVNACNPDHYYGETPQLAIVKKTNGSDNDAAPGVYLAVGAAVTWTYDVTNTGNVALTAVNVTDDKGVAVTCPATVLAVGATMTCTGTGVAAAGQYENTGCAVGTSPTSATVNACNPDHYYGETPQLAIVKKTNGSDNDAAPGVYLAVGAAVTWTYDVTNTGNVALTAVNVTDDKGVAVTCPANVLAVGATMTCTGTGVAAAGQYENTGCAVGTSPTSATVNACNPDHYYGETPQLAIVKKTNGSDNDAAPGVYLAVGAPVTWTYDVTNTGNVALTAVSVTDDKGVAVTCPATVLAVGATMTCTGTGVAAAGQYENTGCAVGTSPTSATVNACNPDHYFGQTPSISIIKKTNGSDNNSAPGIYLAVGSAVSWTYDVTNTGNVALTNVVVTDDRGVAVTCLANVLAAGATMTCTGTGVAAAGQYRNVGAVTGKPPVGPPVTDDDPDHYYGQVPAIRLVKKTNGTDNNSAPGIRVAAGSTVTWTYEVTNIGNVVLTNLALNDDKAGAVSCPVTALAPGASTTCTKSGTAVSGQYTNMGTVTGQPPVGPPVVAADPDNYFGYGEVCYVGTRAPQVGATQTWWANPDGSVTIRTTLSRNFNDNTYGTNQVGWPGSNHKFSHLVTSDMVQIALFDKSGARKLEMKLDYFSESSAFPSGYGSNGPSAKDGGMVFGSLTDVTGADSSLARNFNQFGYVLTTNSPATDAAYTTNPSYPNWIWEAYYDVTVKASAFGASGFGYPRIVTMHASPSKTGVETEPLAVTACGGGGNDEPPPDQPAIRLVKKTNGTNNNTAPGVELVPGSPVTWTYEITNTGNTVLTNLVLTDDKIGSVSCPASQLAPAASTTCTATGVAITGQYTNLGTVTGTAPSGQRVSSADPDNYFGKTAQVCSTSGFTTFTPGGWGAPPSGNNPGMLLRNNFAAVYPSGSVTIGGTKTLKFTSAAAIEAFLPAGGGPSVLTSSAVNPTTAGGGNFAGHLLSMRLALDFSNAGVLKGGLGNLVMASGPLAGQTVNQVIALANAVLGGNTGALPSGMSVSTLSGIVASLNENFDNGTVNKGVVACPGGPTPPPPPTSTDPCPVDGYDDGDGASGPSDTSDTYGMSTKSSRSSKSGSSSKSSKSSKSGKSGTSGKSSKSGKDGGVGSPCVPPTDPCSIGGDGSSKSNKSGKSGQSSKSGVSSKSGKSGKGGSSCPTDPCTVGGSSKSSKSSKSSSKSEKSTKSCGGEQPEKSSKDTSKSSKSGHYAGDGDDHDKGKNGHKAGDGCSHDTAMKASKAGASKPGASKPAAAKGATKKK